MLRGTSKWHYPFPPNRRSVRFSGGPKVISLMRPVGTFAIGLTIVALIFIALERWLPLQNRARGNGARLLRPGWRTDLIYAVASPLVRLPRRLAIGVALVPVAFAVGHGLDVRA